MKRTYVTIAVLSLFVIFGCKSEQPKNTDDKEDQVYNTNGLQWADIDTLTNLEDSGSKKYLIDIYTEWCSWCKVMDKKTFSDPIVQQALKNNFHLIKFNAESKLAVKFDGDRYNWVPQGKRGINELAMKFLEGKMAYPTLVYLDENMKPIRVSQGYQNSEELLQEIEVITKS